MIQFLLVLGRFFRAFAGSYRRDEEFRTLVFVVLFILLAGTIFYSNVEGWSYLDSLYFSVTTLTTVGYGDLAPQTAAGKVFTIVYILSGLGILAGFINTLAKETLTQRARRREARHEKQASRGSEVESRE